MGPGVWIVREASYEKSYTPRLHSVLLLFYVYEYFDWMYVNVSCVYTVPVETREAVVSPRTGITVKSCCLGAEK